MKTGDTVRVKNNGHKAFIFLNIRAKEDEGEGWERFQIYPNSSYLTYSKNSLEHHPQILIEKEIHPWKGLRANDGNGVTNIFGINLLEVQGGLNPREVQ
jgi:hypothetical protein